MSKDFSVSGSFNNSFRFLKKMRNREPWAALEALGKEGVQELQAFTPVDSGVTASSWSYEVIEDDGMYRIAWSNSNVHDGLNIAVILQFGHGTGGGGYVVGRDYINPALRPVFDKISDRAWKAVTSA